ncbi:hypothetical protein [Lacticaseibacillus paracasei]|uniref:hypothetical protein n=1 Tax=Lacticaseibacillus paracasei TaxID=1597 RepID=UPI0021D115ED|nr:hypothetical protein [Lacticaseibacillus paracasei]MCU6430266.1 hypothetical protein [Lacticaseibacillus paracasei]
MDDRNSNKANKRKIAFDDYILAFDVILKKQSSPEMSAKSVRKFANKAIKDQLSRDFFVDKNPSMNEFIHSKALNEQRHGVSKTYFVVNEPNPGQLLGFVTLRMDVLNLESVTLEQRKKLVLKGKSPNNLTQIPWLLIEEVAKNFKIADNPIHLDDLLDVAISTMSQVHTLVGGGVIGLNAINVPRVIAKYHDYGFAPFGDPRPAHANRKVSYQPMFLRISH